MIQRFFEWLARKWSKLEKQNGKPEHEHKWRYITTYARQCKTRTCGLVEYLSSDIPEGLDDYLSIMTSVFAAKEPILASKDYSLIHMPSGAQCSVCGRAMVEDSYCPYCGAGLNTPQRKEDNAINN